VAGDRGSVELLEGFRRVGVATIVLHDCGFPSGVYFSLVKVL
jgi:hypothetical protein